MAARRGLGEAVEGLAAARFSAGALLRFLRQTQNRQDKPFESLRWPAEACLPATAGKR